MKCVSHKFTLWITSALKMKMSVRKDCIGVDEWLPILFEASEFLKLINRNDLKLEIQISTKQDSTKTSLADNSTQNCSTKS